MPYSPFKHLRTVLFLETFLICGLFFVVNKFWQNFCGIDLLSCSNEGISQTSFLLLSTIRPFLLTPLDMIAFIAGQSYGVIRGAILTSLGGGLSCIVVYLLTKIFLHKYLYLWMKQHAPKSIKWLQANDWKIILASRLIPLVPFDILTFSYALLNFRPHHIILFTLIGSLPEILLFSMFGSELSFYAKIVLSILTIFLSFVAPFILLEKKNRKNNTTTLKRTKELYKEITLEIKLSNLVIKEQVHSPDKIPVLLIYGFLSSRRSVIFLEKLYEKRGYEVITFSLGGLWGVFSTELVTETAKLVDIKLKKYLSLHNINKIHILAHSKGGFVSLWWLLKHGGHRYCDKLITMGTPFEGTWTAWLGLLSPLGVFMKDIWQMRPGSDFIKATKELDIPKNLKIYNIYSEKDFVARGPIGVFQPNKESEQIIPISMNHLSHEGFLTARELIDTVSLILDDDR